MPIDPKMIPDEVVEAAEKAFTDAMLTVPQPDPIRSAITIPPAALEAGAALIYAADHSGQRLADVSELTRRIYIEVARAAALALLENWPGMHHYNPHAEPYYGKHIILPLPMENEQ